MHTPEEIEEALCHDSLLVATCETTHDFKNLGSVRLTATVALLKLAEEAVELLAREVPGEIGEEVEDVVTNSLKRIRLLRDCPDEIEVLFLQARVLQHEPHQSLNLVHVLLVMQVAPHHALEEVFTLEPLNRDSSGCMCLWRQRRRRPCSPGRRRAKASVIQHKIHLANGRELHIEHRNAEHGAHQLPLHNAHFALGICRGEQARHQRPDVREKLRQVVVVGVPMLVVERVRAVLQELQRISQH
mmetsp:Transcript_26886/g.88228  ORF Transcript_26886/g.88228 Transcript_26886/m.88228 type:complete len:244 (-) Transcript_26886:1092-1823(-)